ncbi:MAG: phosphatidylserine decarboxylase family protein [Desulfovibrionaceae bacterium]|nr:phosphatidylserine decarboxylase family protein [Desulfovibrionaceae bacterium]
MRQPSLGVAKEGLPFILLLAWSSLVFAAMELNVLAVIFLALTWFTGHFFRDPERVAPAEPHVAVSPADGRIIRIERRPWPFDEKGEETRLCVSIFMNVFNVHVNRSPVACTVEEIVYKPGKFFNAALDKASSDNEQCAWLLADEEGARWGMVQIAGLIARRIVPHAERGDKLALGERYGLIRFGSRVDLYLPDTYTPAVGLGDGVHAGETVIARLAEKNS